MADIITVKDLATYLKVAEKTVYRLLEQGGIPASRVGRQWRFDKTEIDRWLLARSIFVRASILVVDDEEVIRSLFAEVITEQGHGVVTPSTATEALDFLKRQDFDLAFVDLKMPGMNGADFLQRLKSLRPRLPVVVITGYPDSDLISRALEYGPLAVMKKPFGESDILTAVNSFLKTGAPKKTNGEVI